MSTYRYQLENKTPIEKVNHHLIYITSSRYENDWHSIPHSHHCTELFYVTKGAGTFLVEGEVYHVHDDDLIIINPNVVHTETSSKTMPLEYIVVGIEGLEFASISDEYSNESFSIHNYSNHKEEILTYLKTLFQEMQDQKPHYETVCQNLLEVLIINMIRRTKTNLVIAPTQKVTKECLFVEQYINNHFTEDITLEILSEQAYMNKFYLVHAFKQYKGISPISYLIKLRIKHAKDLLIATSNSIAQISESCGFSSQSYFSQVFRKETGMTPNEFRKSRLKQI